MTPHSILRPKTRDCQVSSLSPHPTPNPQPDSRQIFNATFFSATFTFTMPRTNSSRIRKSYSYHPYLSYSGSLSSACCQGVVRGTDFQRHLTLISTGMLSHPPLRVLLNRTEESTQFNQIQHKCASSDPIGDRHNWNRLIKRQIHHVFRDSKRHLVK